jgi:DNA helicase-2/ATP-dependent DNA helicase PcrA
MRRKKKALFTDNDEGRAVRLVEYSDQDDEASSIANEISFKISNSARRASDFAIFYRVNALSRGLERALKLAGVPYQMVRGQEFYQRKEIKDVLAYCQLMNNPRDDQAVMRTINTPARGIGRKTIQRLTDHAYQHGLTLLEAAREAAAIAGIAARSAKKVAVYVELADRLSDLSDGDMEEILGTVLTESGYHAHLSEGDTEEDLNRLANIEELLTDARQFDEANPGGGHLETYLENAWLVNETDGWDDDNDKVTLMTLHAAKGLEFPVVYLVAVEHGLLPHERSTRDEAEIEEERRLAFVGITRAEEELQLSYAVQRDFRGQRRRTVPSSFLMEMPREEIEITQAPELAADWPDSDWAEDQWSDDSFADQTDHEDTSFDVDSFNTPPTNSDSSSADSSTADADSDTTTSSKYQATSARVTTAAELDQSKADPSVTPTPRLSPDAFKQGMAVQHPEHGLGKIVALSGAGKQRRATVRFATAGEKRFVLAHSPLRPAGR